MQRAAAASRTGFVAVVGVVLQAVLTTAGGQAIARPDTTLPPDCLQGSVVAASTGAPIEDAMVTIALAAGGAMPGGDRSAFWHTSRTVRTDANGVYRFDRLAPGRYQLHIQRLGYRSADIEVDLGDLPTLQVSVGLSMLPIVLEPVTVRAVAVRAPSAFPSAWDSLTKARLSGEAERRRRFLATDTRALTSADLTEAVTLGETDLFRALQRVAGVATRDEFTAELWTRGGRWSDTRVMYDGLPLFSPLHAGGTVSGVPPDIVGAAVFHPGVRPASSGEGAAAVVELASRPALEAGVHGAAELSVISARATVEGAGRSGGPRWVLGARRSHIDLATGLLAQLERDSTIRTPYAFADVAGRLDIPLTGSTRLEVSGLWSEDLLGGGIPNLVFGNRGRWGNAVARATLVVPLRGVAMRHTIGVSRYRMRVGSCPDDSCSLDAQIIYAFNTQSDLTYALLRGMFAPAVGDAWTAGYEFASQRLRYVGWGPLTYPGQEFGTIASSRGATDILALWGERRARIGPRLTLQTGLRVETGTRPAGQSPVRIGPRLQARYTISADGLAVSAGLGRSFQYSQTIGPLGPSIGPELHLSDVWMLAGDTIPAVQSDVASGGLEYWIPGGWVAALNLYWRGERGVAVPEPTPGVRYPSHPIELFAVATTFSRGAEVSLRKLTGRLTGSAALALSRSTIDAVGNGFPVRHYRYPAPNDRHAVLHATGLMALTPNLRVGGAMTVTRSVPFTRYLLRSACHGAEAPECPASSVPDVPYVEAPGGARSPGVATLDLLADWSRSYRGWALGAYVQLRNVLRAARAVSYTGSLNRCDAAQASDRVQIRPGVCDVYARGLPTLPFVGVRVSF